MFAGFNIIHHLLSQVPYKPPPARDVTLPKRQRRGGYTEPDLALRYIPTPF
jgi:polyphosphate kinase